MCCHSGRLWYGEPNPITNAIGYAMHYRRSHDAVIRVYDAAGNMIEMQRARGRVQKVVIFVFCHRDLIVHFQKLLLLALRGANSPVKMRAIMRLTISLVVQVVIVIGAVTGAAGAMPSPNGKPEAQTPLATARPYLVSLSVANLDLSVRWYRDMLGFREIRRLNMPGSSLRISFLELNGFRLELIEFKDSVSLAAIQSKFPIVDDRGRVQGFAKLAFAVTSVGEVAAS